MRYLYISLLTIAIALVLLFIVQNPRLTTVAFFSGSVTLPLSFLVLFTYIWGILTGGVVVSLMRILIHGAAKNQN
ncbi:MAG: DUF1049 domain-containing protein [Cyanobacteria bacterium]|jgi:uncharacterized integral membrane protein|nr:DUF1049 domain-containing protein [Cyanobacteria bacterium GSL.Bin21]